jgi:CheY-like chemotaxis protein
VIGGSYLQMTNSPFHALILVVEDDVLERMGASYMFSDAGYRVLEAANTDDALRLFETNSDIRVLFTDISMPGPMNGSDLAHRVAERWPGVAIIMTSGRPRPEKLPLSIHFHAKPYEPTVVLRQAREMTIPLADAY